MVRVVVGVAGAAMEVVAWAAVKWAANGAQPLLLALLLAFHPVCGLEFRCVSAEQEHAAQFASEFGPILTPKAGPQPCRELQSTLQVAQILAQEAKRRGAASL